MIFYNDYDALDNDLVYSETKVGNDFNVKSYEKDKTNKIISYILD